MKALDFQSTEALGIRLIDQDEGGLRQLPASPGLRSGPKGPPSGGLRLEGSTARSLRPP